MPTGQKKHGGNWQLRFADLSPNSYSPCRTRLEPRIASVAAQYSGATPITWDTRELQQ